MTEAITSDTTTPPPAGIDPAGIEAWFRTNVAEVAPPLAYEMIAGGHSNLTYHVRDGAGHRWVLRRPPLGHVLATAHDMSREHRILAALAPTAVPVPPVVGLSPDDAVNGAPFYVMEHVDGRVIRNSVEAEALSEAERRQIGDELIDGLCAIHEVDVDAVGLGDLGRREGYVERQLARWHGQWEKSKTRELPAIDEVHRRLSAQMPTQGPAAIVHGDYRLDNCMIASDSGKVIAVLDWELCTLGDPLADLGLLLVYWGDRERDISGVPSAPSLLPGFADPPELLDRYANRTGRDLSSIDFYVAFGYWKLACIVEGVYARYVAGAMGPGDRERYAPFAVQVELLADLALEHVGSAT